MATQKKNRSETAKSLRNEDPLSGEAGAHPVGTGVGAALGGAAAGAVAGAVAGPIGAAVGAIAGAVGGGLAGKGVAESIDPTKEVEYWRSEYPERSYYSDDFSFDDYEPAYRAGIDVYDTGRQATWTENEAAARARWEDEGGHSRMGWEQARIAAEDAYSRLNKSASKPR